MMRYAACCILATLAWTSASAQSLELRQISPGSSQGMVSVGDTVAVQVWAQLDSISISGVQVYVSLPDDLFEVLDANPQHDGLQPFAAESLLSGAAQFANGVNKLPEGLPAGRTYLHFAAVFAPGSVGSVTGSGPIASLRVRALTPAQQVTVRLESTPIHEARLVRPDGAPELLVTDVGFLTLDIRDRSTVAGDASWADIKSVIAQY